MPSHEEVDVLEENKIDVKEEEVDDDDAEEEWDSKSWDDAVLVLSGKSTFDNEAVDSVPEGLVKKEMSMRPAMV